MRTIDRSSPFKRDYKREARGQHKAILDTILMPVWHMTSPWSHAFATTI